MNTSRRNFLKYSAMVGTGVFFRQMDSFAIASEASKFLEKIGVCTGITNNGVLAAAGYSYLEDGVRSFLIPSEDETAFQAKLALLKESKIPV
jgi:hypothetical protein